MMSHLGLHSHTHTHSDYCVFTECVCVCVLSEKVCRFSVSLSADGLFGQCQDPLQEPARYQVSIPVLRRLQEVLKDLMLQGEFIRAAKNTNYS